jgi:hypothetical protein
MKKLYYLMAVAILFSAKTSLAVCPACTLAVGMGVGFSRWLGIDDAITGIWIGALIVSISIWTINWMNKKNYRFKGRKILIFLGYYLIIIVPLYWKGIMGHQLNKILGIDKLLFGIIIGSMVFSGSAWWYEKMKKKNNDRAYFPYQKVAMPVGLLAVFSLIFYFITKN